MKILISPGYGSGWSTNNNSFHPENADKIKKAVLTWPALIEAVERGDKIDEHHPAILSLHRYILELDPEFTYLSCFGLDALTVENVKCPFRIDEYDGCESVEEMEYGNGFFCLCGLEE